MNVAQEWNQFIEGLDLSESGTLISKYNKHNLVRSEINGKYLWGIPKTNRWTLSMGGQVGWISNTSADSFFHFFAGGMTGLKGYPFYSLCFVKNIFQWVGSCFNTPPLVLSVNQEMLGTVLYLHLARSILQELN